MWDFSTCKAGTHYVAKPHGTRWNDSDINDNCIKKKEGSNLSAHYNLVGTKLTKHFGEKRKAQGGGTSSWNLLHALHKQCLTTLNL